MQVLEKKWIKGSDINEKVVSNLLDVINEFEHDDIEYNSSQVYELSEYLKSLVHSDVKQKKEILEHEKKTTALNEELKKFKLAVDNASDFISILSEDNEVMYVNRALLDYCGYQKEDLYWKKMAEILRRGEDIEMIREMFAMIKETNKPYTTNLKTTKKNGAVFIAEVTYTPIIDKINWVLFYLLIERDITKELELDSMKNEFLSIASHELRTPMTVIKWYSDILLSEKYGTITEKQKGYLERIDTNIVRLVDIVNDMLDISKLESGKIIFCFEKFDIGKMLQTDIFQYFEDMCHKKNICLTILAESLLVESDAEKIRQVLINLVWNACKFTEIWWKIEISLKRPTDNQFQICIKDNGVGISNANCKNIFKKFYQVKNHLQKKEEGTGLGLTISKTIIESLGWDIIAQENPDETWAIFSFTLNISPEKNSL